LKTQTVFIPEKAVHAEQHGHLDMEDLRVALEKLPEDQREAIILVGASGFSYEEAADICSVAVGTIKSRVNRARVKLTELLNPRDAENFATDKNSAGILNNVQRN
jgi:RNA polymerase sigma-70 factor, ECF subfamily